MLKHVLFLVVIMLLSATIQAADCDDSCYIAAALCASRCALDKDSTSCNAQCDSELKACIRQNCPGQSRPYWPKMRGYVIQESPYLIQACQSVSK